MKLKYCVLLFCLFNSVLGWSQNNIQTSGTNSHNFVNNGSGTIQVFVTPNAAQISKVVSSLNDPGINAAAKLINQGDYAGALEEVRGYLRTEKDSRRKIAAVKFIEGQILFYTEQFDLANESFGVSVNLMPRECSYRVAYGYSMVSMGMFNQASKLMAQDRSETVHCLASGNAVDQAGIYLINARVAYERRDRDTTYKELDRAYKEIIAARNHKLIVSWIEPACLFNNMQFGLPSEVQMKWPNLRQECSKSLSNKNNGQRSLAQELFDFYPTGSLSSSPQIGEELRKKWRDPSLLNMPNADLAGKRALYGAFLSELGFRTLWTVGDVRKASELYRDAFDTLEPLIASGRSSILTDAMQLVVRITHLRRSFDVQAPLPVNDVLREAVLKAGKSIYDDNSLAACRALERITDAGGHLLSVQEWDANQQRSQRCNENIVPLKSWSALKGRLSIAEQRIARDESSANYENLIAIKKELNGFPSEADEGKFAETMMYLALFKKKNKFPDAEIEQSTNLAIREAIKEFPSLKSRFIISLLLPDSTIPSDEINPIVFESLAFLEKPAQESKSEISACINQSRRLNEIVPFLEYAILERNEPMLRRASILWKSEVLANNRCRTSSGSGAYALAIDATKIDRAVSVLYVNKKAPKEKVNDSCKQLRICSLLSLLDEEPLLQQIVASD